MKKAFIVSCLLLATAFALLLFREDGIQTGTEFVYIKPQSLTSLLKSLLR